MSAQAFLKPAKIQYTIYDRWGEKVFQTNDANVCWDGKYKGKEMDMAVFCYLFEGVYYTGETIVLKGNITLLR